MKRFLATVGLIISGAASMVCAADLNVYVKNAAGTPLPGARVIAVRFADNGPDAADTKIGVADATGLVAFTGGIALAADKTYDIFAATQGFLPGLSDQLNDPEHPHLFTSGTLDPVTVTVSSAGVSGVGQINADVNNATPNSIIFGEVRPATGYDQEAVAKGWVVTDGGGAGTIEIINVPYVSTTAYKLDAFDPIKQKGTNFTGTQELAAYRPLVRYYAAGNALEAYVLNFDNAIQKQNTQTLTQQYGISGDVSVTGVVIDTNTAENQIPYIGVNFSYYRNDPYCQGNCSGNIWANVGNTGSFQLYGLQQNTSYYAQVYGGCTWNGSSNACYDGYNSTWSVYGSSGAPLGLNDFYYGSQGIVKKIRLPLAAGGSGVMAVYIKDSQDMALPQGGVSLWPDGMQWDTDGNCGTSGDRINQPGLANFNGQATTGYALIENLRPGNYSLQAWTQFSQSGGTQFNAGADGQFSWGGSNCGSDDRRLTISTTAPNVHVYDATGVELYSGSSVTITIDVPQQTSGQVKGTLTFPGLVDLTDDPINITLQVQCSPGDPCNGSGYHVVSGAVGPTYDYEVNVASGQSYWMNVTSKYWGVVRLGGGGNAIKLENSTSAVVNMTFAPAGRVMGKLYKPGNVLFTPTFSQSNSVSASINFSGQNSYGWGQVNQDGSYSVGGLLPGKYSVRAQGWGDFAYTDPLPLPEVTVVANQDLYRDLNVVDGVPVRILVSTAALPAIARPACDSDSWNCPPENWTVYPMARGASLTEKATLILTNGDEQSEFAFAVSTASGRCGGPSSDVGFCVRYKPTPSVGDFYLLRKGQFDGDNIDGVWPYFVVLNSTKNVTMTKDMANTPFYWANSGSTVNVINLDLNPSDPALVPGGLGQATLSGSVIGQSIIRQVDFTALGGDFNNFMKYLPIISFYDSTGTFRAAALVVPNPTCLPEHGAENIALEKSVAEGDWTTFKNVFENCPGGYGYQIRGLSAGQTYKAVLTTPNYPPYDNRVTVGIAGSTTTLNINLDVEVGAGATLLGVVSSTNGAAIPTAQVSIEAEGYNNNAPKSFTTGAVGDYKFEGLPKGSYKISVVASGYGFAVSKIDVEGNTTFTRNIALSVAGGVITGTVKSGSSREPLRGKIFAYNDSLNVASPSSELSLYKQQTSTSGFYTLDGLTVGDIYKISAKVPGYYIASRSTRTIAGTVTGIDFLMVKKPLDVKVFARRTGTDFEFTVLNPGDFRDGDAWVGASPFVKAVSTNVGNGFMEQMDSGGNKILVLRYPAASLGAGDHVLHIEALSGAYVQGVIGRGDKVVKEVLFGLDRSGCASQSLDDVLLGDDSEGDLIGRNSNQAPLDVSGANDSALTVPAGSMFGDSSYVVPSFSLCQQSVGAFAPSAALSNDAFVSDVYRVALSSVTITDKGFDLTLDYDQNASNLTDIAIYHYNTATSQWEVVPGIQTPNKEKGTLTTRVRSLSSMGGLSASHSMKAMAVGGTYVPNSRYRTLAASDAGSFAVLRPSLVGAAYAGDKLKVFNFPNPFNLALKTVPIVHGGATLNLPTDGTVIKYELPTGTSGRVMIRIYTIAGELVAEMDEGDRTGGSYFYTTWDGRNRTGGSVANGVYYGVLTVPGQKAKSGTFKLAVIK